jgi:predicted ester cyclase
MIPSLRYCLLSASIAFVGMLAVRAQEKDIPVPKSLSIDPDLPKTEAKKLLNTGKLFYAFWNTGNEKYLDESVSKDFYDNTLPKGRPQGYKGVLFASANFRKAVPDLRCSVEDLIITKDKIVCRQVYTGHNTGSVNGNKPSGKSIRFIAIDILHVRDGKVYEDWHLEDNLTFLQQIGVVNLK